MEATDTYPLKWKKAEAWGAHRRRLETDPTERYRVPIYHIGLVSYLRWILAALLPNPIDDAPITLGHVDYEACVKDYGWPRPLSDVNDFLQDLLGNKFTAAYGFSAGLVDYQYLADKVSDIIAHQSERERPIPRGLTRADNWLNEQIAQLKATRDASKLAAIAEKPVVNLSPYVASIPVESSKLTLRQVALLYIYQGSIIRAKADEANAIAQQYGYTSGQKLYHHYRILTRRAERTGVEGKAIAPMITDITAIIIHLSEAARQQAESDLQVLQAKT